MRARALQGACNGVGKADAPTQKSNKYGHIFAQFDGCTIRHAGVAQAVEPLPSKQRF